MGSFKDYAVSARMRDAIVRLCEKTIERMRPAARYATVVSIDTTNYTVEVRYPGETDTVTIPVGSVLPSRVGQTVRIKGSSGDRYVDDVIGAATTRGGGVGIGTIIEVAPGVDPGDSFLPADGRTITVASYPAYALAVGASPSASSVVLPNKGDNFFVRVR